METEGGLREGERRYRRREDEKKREREMDGGNKVRQKGKATGMCPLWDLKGHHPPQKCNWPL